MTFWGDADPGPFKHATGVLFVFGFHDEDGALCLGKVAKGGAAEQKEVPEVSKIPDLACRLTVISIPTLSEPVSVWV